MRLPLALCVLVLLGIGANACGSATDGAGSTPSTTSSASATRAAASTPPRSDKSRAATTSPHDQQKPAARDGDSDDDGNGYYDHDDNSILDFGHTANPDQKQTISALVRRYMAAAAAANGAAACSMLYSTYAEAVPEDYGTAPPGPAYARGKTCAAVLTHVFDHVRTRIVAETRKFHVSRVRVEGRRGVTVLSFPRLPPTEIRVQLEGPKWKILGLVDSRLP